MIHDALFSSRRQDWETPNNFLELLEDISGGPFDLDPCATQENTKASAYIAQSEDGLQQAWFGKVYMNPPYGRDVSKWVEKAFNEVRKHNADEAWCLLPVRTDTKWWHDYCMHAQEIYFIRGRLKFQGAENSAPFPSCVVVFRKEHTRDFIIRSIGRNREER